jgi:hypothetical protein
MYDLFNVLLGLVCKCFFKISGWNVFNYSVPHFAIVPATVTEFCNRDWEKKYIMVNLWVKLACRSKNNSISYRFERNINEVDSLGISEHIIIFWRKCLIPSYVLSLLLKHLDMINRELDKIEDLIERRGMLQVREEERQH